MNENSNIINNEEIPLKSTELSETEEKQKKTSRRIEKEARRKTIRRLIYSIIEGKYDIK